MESQAVAGIGTKFYRWSSTSSQWEQVAEVVSISGPGMSRETIEVTSLDSEGGYREFIAGLRDAGTISLGMNFRRDNYELLKEDFESNERKSYKIVLPDTDGTTLEFLGLVMELPLNVDTGDRISMDITIQVSGEIDLYDDSSGA